MYGKGGINPPTKVQFLWQLCEERLRSAEDPLLGKRPKTVAAAISYPCEEGYTARAI